MKNRWLSYDLCFDALVTVVNVALALSLYEFIAVLHAACPVRVNLTIWAEVCSYGGFAVFIGFMVSGRYILTGHRRYLLAILLTLFNLVAVLAVVASLAVYLFPFTGVLEAVAARLISEAG